MRARIRAVVPILVALGAACLAACDARQSVAQGGAAALARNLALARTVEIHVDEEAAAEPLRRLAALERARSGRDVRVLVQTPGDPDAARIVIGTPRSGVAATLAARAGIEMQGGGGFRVADLDHEAPEDAARATFADPDRPGLPVTLWLGNDLARLVPQIEDAIPRATPSFATWRGGDLVLRGNLRPAGGLVQRDLDRVGLARLALRGPVDASTESDGFKLEIAPGIEAVVAARILRELEAARARAAAWTGAPAPRVAVRLLSAVEDLRLGGESDSLGRWNRARPAADMLVLAGVTDGGAAATRAGLRAVLGPAVVAWIEDGASVSAARSWWGRDLDRWLARLAIAGALPRAAVLVDPRSDAQISAHVLVPARAALFDHLRATRGDEYVRSLWCGTRAFEADEDLEESFAAALRARTEPHREEVARRGEQRRRSVLGAAPVAGVAFAESAMDPRIGYGSIRAHVALRSARTRGARSVALDAVFRDAGIGDPWGAPRALAPECGDVALFATAFAARHLGMRVALYPSVLASDAGSYSGAWTRNEEGDWAAYFAHHARAVEHAALLASLCSVDWLSVGSSLRAVSSASSEERRSRPEEAAWKHEGWRRVIGAARGAFSGGLTYGAGDVAEAEKIAFWGDLDAVGMDLDPRAEPGAAFPRLEIEHSLRLALEGLDRVARRFERPAVLTRVTFAPELRDGPAIAGDWGATQIDALSSALQSATSVDGLDLRAVWLARVGTDPADRGCNPHDPVLRPEMDAALGSCFAAAPSWVRAGSRSGERSPR